MEAFPVVSVVRIFFCRETPPQPTKLFPHPEPDFTDKEYTAEDAREQKLPEHRSRSRIDVRVRLPRGENRTE